MGVVRSAVLRPMPAACRTMVMKRSWSVAMAVSIGRCRPCLKPTAILPPVREQLDTDVAIVGAGVVGCAVARELSQFDLRVTLLEAGPDVGAGTSKANTALLHTGFDAKPGTREARLVPRGYELLSSYAAATGIPVERSGALLGAGEEAQLGESPGVAERPRASGYAATRELAQGELTRREPRLGP